MSESRMSEQQMNAPSSWSRTKRRGGLSRWVLWGGVIGLGLVVVGVLRARTKSDTKIPKPTATKAEAKATKASATKVDSLPKVLVLDYNLPAYREYAETVYVMQNHILAFVMKPGFRFRTETTDSSRWYRIIGKGDSTICTVTSCPSPSQSDTLRVRIDSGLPLKIHAWYEPVIKTYLKIKE